MQVIVVVIEQGHVIDQFETDTKKHTLPAADIGQMIADRLYIGYYGNLYRIGHKQPYKLALSRDPIGLIHYDTPDIKIYIADKDSNLVYI